MVGAGQPLRKDRNDDQHPMTNARELTRELFGGATKLVVPPAFLATVDKLTVVNRHSP
jgi:hypothetical protein